MHALFFAHYDVLTQRLEQLETAIQRHQGKSPEKMEDLRELKEERNETRSKINDLSQKFNFAI